MFSSRENQLLRRALSLYGGERVLEQVLRDGDAALSPRARDIELTILCLDIAAFTAAEVGLTPEQLGEWGSQYCEGVTQTIREGGGYIDKFIGDAAIAWWGEDTPEDHALHCCRCARELLATVSRLNSGWKERGFPEIRLRIGINTGIVSCGSFGSIHRLQYTIMGEHVNMANRLSSMAGAEYPSAVLIAGSTNRQLANRLPTRHLASSKVKGRADPLEVYELAF